MKNIVRVCRFFVAIFLCVQPYTTASAAIPTTIHYQGYLTDASAVPQNAELAMRFRLYTDASGGAAAWDETHGSVSVQSGRFSVELGSNSAFPADLFTVPLYLGITVGADAEMTPRLRLGSVPYAFTGEQTVACVSGQTNCDGQCADLQSDENHCGTCGTACADGDVCDSGACVTCLNLTLYYDGDGDGYGHPDLVTLSCQPRSGFVADATDCNDFDWGVNPGRSEVCDGIDNDCDAQIDEGCP